METECDCLTCGYTWERGQDGSHHCASVLLERIPKTADGRAIFLGDTVFCENFDRSWFGDDPVLAVKVTSIVDGLVFNSYSGTVTVSGEDVEMGNLDFYSTPEAVPVASGQ